MTVDYYACCLLRFCLTASSDFLLGMIGLTVYPAKTACTPIVYSNQVELDLPLE